MKIYLKAFSLNYKRKTLIVKVNVYYFYLRKYYECYISQYYLHGLLLLRPLLMRLLMHLSETLTVKGTCFKVDPHSKCW